MNRLQVHFEALETVLDELDRDLRRLYQSGAQCVIQAMERVARASNALADAKGLLPSDVELAESLARLASNGQRAAAVHLARLIQLPLELLLKEVEP